MNTTDWDIKVSTNPSNYISQSKRKTMTLNNQWPLSGRKENALSAKNHGYLDIQECKYRTQLHLIAVEEDSHSNTELEGNMVTEQQTSEEEGPELQISLHAMSGTTNEAKTFPLFVHIGNIKLVALIDSGTTTTFMDPSVIVQIGLPVINHKPVKVTVVNAL
jgi:hypothetical protein